MFGFFLNVFKGIFDQIYNKNSEILLQLKIAVFYVTILKSVIYSCDQS